MNSFYFSSLCFLVQQCNSQHCLYLFIGFHLQVFVSDMCRWQQYHGLLKVQQRRCCLTAVDCCLVCLRVENITKITKGIDPNSNLIVSIFQYRTGPQSLTPSLTRSLCILILPDNEPIIQKEEVMQEISKDRGRFIARRRKIVGINRKLQQVFGHWNLSSERPCYLYAKSA